ncbi:MAG: Ig-like domain-containing protein, partial [Planctomycetota bacterium]|nr:Ig-like domain-containing protein [Planctomycetota bacterium]
MPIVNVIDSTGKTVATFTPENTYDPASRQRELPILAIGDFPVARSLILQTTRHFDSSNANTVGVESVLRKFLQAGFPSISPSVKVVGDELLSSGQILFKTSVDNTHATNHSLYQYDLYGTMQGVGRSIGLEVSPWVSVLDDQAALELAEDKGLTWEWYDQKIVDPSYDAARQYEASLISSLTNPESGSIYTPPTRIALDHLRYGQPKEEEGQKPGDPSWITTLLSKISEKLPENTKLAGYVWPSSQSWWTRQIYPDLDPYLDTFSPMLYWQDGALWSFDGTAAESARALVLKELQDISDLGVSLAKVVPVLSTARQFAWADASTWGLTPVQWQQSQLNVLGAARDIGITQYDVFRFGSWFDTFSATDPSLGTFLDRGGYLASLGTPRDAPPTIISRTFGFGRDTNIWVQFSEDMDDATFNNSTILVSASSTGIHSSSFSFDHATHILTIDPDVNFANGETVTVTIGTGVKDMGGNGIDGDGDGQTGPAYPPDPSWFRWQISTVQQESIQRAIDWLRTNQQANGSWSNDAANTSMAVLAMLNAGYKETDTIVSRGIQSLLAQVHADGSVGTEPGRYTYRTALAIVPLVATHNTAYHDQISKMRTWLIGSQWDENSTMGNVPQSNWQYGGFGYGNSSRPDLSNTQWALMGLKAADVELGLQASDTYNKALTFLDRRRNTDGGSGYAPDYLPQSIHTMTAASVWSYRLCGIDQSDPRVTGGMDWLARNYSVSNNDGTGWAAEFYYAVTLAKALVMSHKTRLDAHDWFGDLSSYLRSKQESAGSWPATGGAIFIPQELNTAWAIQAMQTRELPPGVDVSMSMILKSHADLHVYDPQGQHLGVNHSTASLEKQIPGATLKYYDDSGDNDGIYQPGEERIPSDYLHIPVEWVQVVTLPQLAAGSYRTELIGTSSGPFELHLRGTQDGSGVPGSTFSGSIVAGERLATTTTVTAMEGALTLLTEPLAEMPTLDVWPNTVHASVVPGGVKQMPLEVKEAGGTKVLHSVSIHTTDFVGTWGTIPASVVTFDHNSFDVPAGGTRGVTASFAIPAGFEGTATGSIIVESTDGGTRTVNITLDFQPLVVQSLTATPSGFSVQFNRAVDRTVLSLYDNQSQFLGASDVVLKDSTNKVVSGTFVVPGPDQTQFVATCGALAAGTYTVTLRSAADGFKDHLTGQLLDGEYSGTFPTGDGTPGGDFVYQIVVMPPAPLIVSLPDFARAPAQTVDVPTVEGIQPHSGLPIRLSDANGVTSASMKITYDPSLLVLTNVAKGPDLPEGSEVMVNLDMPGEVWVTFSALFPMPSGPTEIVTLNGVVPRDAPYGAAAVLRISDLEVNAGALAATADDGLQVVALVGDANGNQRYDAEDYRLVGRVGKHFDTGFAAYPMIDPLIIGDVTGDGTLSPLDASDLMRQVIQRPTPNIPPLPGPPVNLAPKANGQSVTTAEDTPVEITLTGDDGNPEVVQNLRFEISTRPAHGTLANFDPVTGTGTYTPNPNFNGTDSFTFTVTDDDKAGPPANLTSTLATVTITVTAVNDRPVANPQSVTTTEDTAVSTKLTGDDGDPEVVQALTFVVTTQPAHGTITSLNASTGDVTYTPDPDYSGSDSFGFSVVDDNKAGRPPGLMSTEATVTIRITEVNDPPRLVSGTVANLTVAEDSGLTPLFSVPPVFGPGGGSDEAAQTLTYAATAVPPPTLGTVVLADGSTPVNLGAYALAQLQGMRFKPLPNVNGGPGTFSFTVTDDGTTNGAADHKTLAKTLTITVTAVNDGPTLDSIGPAVINEDAGIQTVNLSGMGPGGGSDEAGQALAATATSNNPGLIPNPVISYSSPNTTGSLSYTPIANANGTAVITVTVTDNGGTTTGGVNTLSRSFTITINPKLPGLNDSQVVCPDCSPELLQAKRQGLLLAAEDLVSFAGYDVDSVLAPVTFHLQGDQFCGPFVEGTTGFWTTDGNGKGQICLFDLEKINRSLPFTPENAAKLEDQLLPVHEAMHGWFATRIANYGIEEPFCKLTSFYISDALGVTPDLIAWFGP